MGRTIGSKPRVHSKKAKSEKVRVVEPLEPSSGLPEIYFKVLKGQPVPVRSAEGALSLDQTAKKTGWMPEALKFLHELFLPVEKRQCRWLDDMRTFHSAAVELRESLRFYADSAPDEYQDEKRGKEIDERLMIVIDDLLEWMGNNVLIAVSGGEIPSVTNLIVRHK